MALTAFFNTESHAVWVEAGDTDAQRLREAADRSDAYAAVGEAGFVRTGNWLPAYGPVVSATLAGSAVQR